MGHVFDPLPQHRYTLRPSLPDPRDDVWATPLAGASLVQDIGVNPIMKNQGAEGSCTGQSTSTARESLDLLAGRQWQVYSAAFMYWMARQIEGTTTEDSGANLRDDMKVLANAGVCNETLMPYAVGQYTQAPSDAAIADALANGRIGHYWQVPQDRVAIASVFAAKQPAVTGISVYQTFETVGSDGRVPMPERGAAPLGGHALMLRGSDDDGVWGQNSWGGGWGKQGFFHLPWDYIESGQYTFDLWTFAL